MMMCEGREPTLPTCWGSFPQMSRQLLRLLREERKKYLHDILSYFGIRKNFFFFLTVKVTKHRIIPPGEAVGFPSLEILRTQLNTSLSNLL